MRRINYPLIVSDFDGTLVNNDGTISERNKKAITEYVEAGGAFAVSTGRLPGGILPRVRELGLTGKVCCCNGAIVIDTEHNEVLMEDRLSLEATLSACKKMEELGLHIHAYDMWDFYAFDNFDGRKISTEEREKSLATDNSYGVCAWDFDREDNVDHQTVNVSFTGGATATFSMVGGATRAQRSLHLVGTKGEIIGVFEDNKIILRKIAPHEKNWFTEQVIETSAPTFGHAGGDIALIESFVDILRGKEPDFRACNLESASDAYRIAFATEDAMNEGRTVWL